MTLMGAAALASGLVARPEALLDVRHTHDHTGRRTIEVRSADGWLLDLEVDRGLDIGSAWYRGSPVSWRSPIADDPGPAFPWEERFLGGLLATCGTENIGPADDGSMHGSHHGRSAANCHIERFVSGDLLGVRVRGEIESTSFRGRLIKTSREIEICGASVSIRDSTRNAGPTSSAVALLYHVNLGFPIVGPGATVSARRPHALPRDDQSGRTKPWSYPPLTVDAEPSVHELVGVPALGSDEQEVVTVSSLWGRTVEIVWSVSTMPRLYAWSWPRNGIAVLAIEPSNAPLFGDERLRPHAGAPILNAGETVHTAVTITVR